MAQSLALLVKKPRPTSKPAPTDTEIRVPAIKKPRVKRGRDGTTNDVILHSKRARRPPTNKELHTLTTDENGKAINDAYGMPLEKTKDKKKSQKENNRPTKRAK
ncbi:hypothetical protein H0H93_013994 [Arthromyces matolae]|nr:hypothetical protein H0H93_013994 [Arthromyces matolae]